MTELSPDLKAIADIVGEENYSTDPMDILCYSRDLAPMPEELLKAYGMIPPVLIVRPGDADQIARIMKVTREKDIPVTPRGGGSFALGGTLPMEGGVVLDLCSMRNILEINESDQFVRVQCGLEWRRLADHLEQIGFRPGANPSSGVSATIGGYLATGGGAGIGVPRNGVVGNQVLALKVVLPDGQIVETNPWDSWLFIGAEGTLGIIVEATLKIFPKLEDRYYMFAFDSLHDGVEALGRLAQLRPYFLHFLDRGAVKFLNDSGAELKESEITIIALFNGSDKQLDIISREIEEIAKDAFHYPEEKAREEWKERYKVEIRFKRLGPTLMLQEVRLPIRNLEGAMRDLAGLLRYEQWGIQSLSSDNGSVCLLIYILTDERD